MSENERILRNYTLRDFSRYRVVESVIEKDQQDEQMFLIIHLI